MALNLEGVRFQNFKNLDFLSAMNAAQLNNYLLQELEDIKELQTQISGIKKDIGRETAQMGTSIGNISLGETKFSNSEMIAKIQAARAQKVKLAAELRSLKELQKETKRVSKQMGSHGGSDAHEAYGRVMAGLTRHAEELRESWDSDDVITIDDIVIEEGISYDEALAQFKYRRSQTTAYDRGTAPTDDE